MFLNVNYKVKPNMRFIILKVYYAINLEVSSRIQLGMYV